MVVESKKSPFSFKYLINLLRVEDDDNDNSNFTKEPNMKDQDNKKGTMSFAELLDTIDVPDGPVYEFPYEEYHIIGDTTEIDRIINTNGHLNIDVIDVKSTLSKDAVNYISIGHAYGADCMANALKDALGKLPIQIDNISKLLFNIWISKDIESPMVKSNSMADVIRKLPTNIDIVFGCAFDESLSGQYVKVSLIAASK